MLSRVADSLYWTGRYLERAENITRLLLVTEDFSSETQGLAEDLAQTAWKDMLAIFPAAQLTREITPFAPLSVPYLQTFFTDQANAYSILFSIRKARENARSVREALTLEVFLALNEAFRALETYERRACPTCRRSATRSAPHTSIFAVVGAIEHTCTRDEGWRFLKLGESLERAYCSALVLRTSSRRCWRPRRAATRRSTTRSGARSSGPVLARELPARLRRAAGAESGHRLPAVRSRFAALAPLRRVDRPGLPRGDLRAGRGSPPRRGSWAGSTRTCATTTRRRCAGATSRGCSIGSSASWPRPTTRSPPSTS